MFYAVDNGLISLNNIDAWFLFCFVNVQEINILLYAMKRWNKFTSTTHGTFLLLLYTVVSPLSLIYKISKKQRDPGKLECPPELIKYERLEANQNNKCNAEGDVFASYFIQSSKRCFSFFYL